MIIGSEVLDDGTLMVSYYDADGRVAFVKKRLMEHEMFNWVESKVATPHKNWDGKYVKAEKSQGRWINSFRIQELILEKFSKEELELIHNFDNFPRKSYLDIEIKLIDESFPDAERARMPVGLISFCNEDNITYILSIFNTDERPEGLSSEDIVRMEKEVNEYFKGIVPPDPNDKKILNQDFKIKYKFFDTEQELLEFYFHKVVPKMSFITGWNVTEFDWKYLMNRCSNQKIDATATLPSKALFSKVKIPTHLGLLDYMQVFETLKPYKVVENYKLDYVANLVLGATKLKHDYKSFIDFQKDTYLFTMYNVVDVILVKLIEDKLALLDVAYSVASVAQIDVNRVFSPVHISEALMCREFLNNGRKMMKLPWGRNNIEKSKYAGAYVKDPIPGYYRCVSCYDFSSMYPNIQIQFNISPDSYLGKKGEVRVNGTEISTKNDTYFSSEKDSASRVILTRLYDARLETQAEMKALENSKSRG